jgi:hypothetical protein
MNLMNGVLDVGALVEAYLPWYLSRRMCSAHQLSQRPQKFDDKMKRMWFGGNYYCEPGHIQEQQLLQEPQ